jgi:hypothetical protein
MVKPGMVNRESKRPDRPRRSDHVLFEWETPARAGKRASPSGPAVAGYLPALISLMARAIISSRVRRT